MRIVEVAPGIYNAFDQATEERLAIAARTSGDWWIGCRIGDKRRELHIPDGDAKTAIRRLLSP